MPPQIRSSNPQYNQLPIADIRRRVGAAAIDFLLAWITSTWVGGALGGAAFSDWIIFLASWYGMRVLLVLNNQGQSPGHWALDMKVVQETSGRMPRQESLLKREGSLGFACSLFMVALTPSHSALLLVLILPLGFDFWLASTDQRLGQTLHDRWGRTVVINTLRGYSLDVKLRQRLQEFQERSRQSR
jgi:uncharacterized RDD family membrane protein YckC